MNSIEVLREMTENLPPIPKLKDLVLESDILSHKVIYNTTDGTSFGIGLFSSKDVSVMRLFVEKGTQWPSHVHNNEIEWGIVYSGKLRVIIKEEEIILVKGGFIQFDRGCPHCSIALEDTWLIAVSVPKIEGYPE